MVPTNYSVELRGARSRKDWRRVAIFSSFADAEHYASLRLAVGITPQQVARIGMLPESVLDFEVSAIKHFRVHSAPVALIEAADEESSDG